MVTILGIKQPDVDEVTGTIVMMDNPDNGDDSAKGDSMSMKRSVTGIILNPQPHDNPQDPLNWPVWRRDLCLILIGFQSFLGGGQSPLLAADLSNLEVEFHKSPATIAYLVGAFMLALGVGSVFASPTAVLYGKRLVYLIGILLFLIGSLVGGGANSFGALMAARIITGFGASPTESLPSATIAEIYFAHERAYRVGIYTMLLLGGKNIMPLLSGLIFQYLDRHWLYWILSMFLGVNLILTFLFVPDTFWDREPTPNKRSIEETEAAKSAANYHDPLQRPNAFAIRRPTTENNLMTYHSASTLNSEATSKHGADTTPIGITDQASTTAENTEVEIALPERRKFTQKIALFNGRQCEDSWWMVALRPFFLYMYPSVLFGSITYALAVVWLIVISEVISTIFKGGEYSYDQGTIGLFYIAPFVGGILGSLTVGLGSDKISRYLVSKNKGMYEPEFRLIMLIPSTFFICIGLMGFGWSAHLYDLWIAPVIFFGCVGFGSSVASTTAITFTVDSYKVFAAEALVSFNFLKNLLGFLFSLFNPQFVHDKGSRTAFITFGCVQIFVSLFGIPLYIYGKSLRARTDRLELLKYLYR